MNNKNFIYDPAFAEDIYMFVSKDYERYMDFYTKCSSDNISMAEYVYLYLAEEFKAWLSSRYGFNF